MTGWAYADKIFAFGGATLDRPQPAGVGFLNDFGEFGSEDCTNQLFCFDTSCQEWSNLKSSGMVPCPRHNPCSTAIDDKAWLFGGLLSTAGSRLFDFYELNIPHLMWTQIETPELLRTGSYFSINAITRNQFVVHGTKGKENTFILDLTSLSWKEYRTIDYCRQGQTSVPGLNSTIMIAMGKIGAGEKPVDCSNTCCIRLEPMSLQQLAIKTVHKHQATLPCRNLPRKLICKMKGIWEYW